ncbi:MAG: rhodanese-like domain-containing protein [Firmicutes bacterium]|nr:rhodanese-like domain-containing protein [Bacillota bacterium]
MKKKLVLGLALLAMFGIKHGEQIQFPNEITAKRLKEWTSKGKDLIIIDVRQPEEFEQSHIPDSILIPLDTIEESQQIADLERNSPIIVVCHSGNRSRTAQRMLQEMGFTRVANLTGGMLAWAELE